ncbi:MAG TPA: beta-propeller fold lactonase family protein [Kofleriaceae bacterium]|nr:beta-propeller fold lactonase family protein [Kofleriaceae bacterium]
MATSGYALLAVLAIAPGAAAADNFAPVARASATPGQAFVGDPVQLSSAGSIDPDHSPRPLAFQWDFDDGGSSTEPSPTHVFTEARAHAVTLTVSDGADTAVAVVIVHVLGRPLPAPSRRSSPMALSPDGGRLWVVNPDSDSVSAIDVGADRLALVAEQPVCRHPRTVSLADAGDVLFVACQGERAVVAIDLPSGRTTTIPVGAEPYAVVALAGGAVLVGDQGDDTLTLIGADRRVLDTWPTADGPRAIAVSADGARAYVTSYLSRGRTGVVTIHDLAARAVIGTVELQDDPGPDSASSGRGVPNLLSAAAIDPSGQRLWLGGLKANTSAGLFRTGGRIAPVNWLRGLAAPVDLSSMTEVLVRRIDTNDADSVSAIALSADGRYGYFAHQGAGTLSIYDLSKATLFAPGAGASVPFEGRIDVGDAPHGIAIAPDGRTVFVSNYLGRDVVAIDVSVPASPRITSRVEVTTEPLTDDVLNGKRLFYRSREPIHSKSNYVACASCHADGATTDGQVWDFTQDGEGLRNTIDLRGRAGLGHGRLHWSANFDEIQDFENPIVKLFGGTGLAQDGAPPNPPLGVPNAGRSRDLDDLAAYVTSLRYTPVSPERGADGALTPAATRGAALLLEPALRCTECHPPPTFTISRLDDPELIDVGTLTAASGQRLGGPLTGLDVPTLIGLWDGAPYFHDGSARTLRDVFRGRANLEAALTAGLPDDQLDDLLAYLASIDQPAPPPTPPPPDNEPAGCGCRTSDPSTTAVAAGLALVALRPRRRASTVARKGAPR